MNKEELLRRYIDDELSPDEEQEALYMIADDPEFRSLLKFEYKLRSGLSESRLFEYREVPEGFSDRVMNAIERSESREENTFVDRVKRLMDQLWTPHSFELRPVYGVAVMMILIVAAIAVPVFTVQQGKAGSQIAASNSSIQQVSKSADRVWLRFIYIDKQAESMAVAGDFSNWDPIPLTKQVIDGDQVWTGLVPMSRGEHRYMFIRNGEEWITDPLAPVQREDGFGNKNAVIHL